MTNSEEWRPVKNYEKLYEVSSLGNVRSKDAFIKYVTGRRAFRKGRILSPYVKGNVSYPRVRLSIKNITKDVSVHRLVATSFIENTHKKAAVNHKNGIKSDNRVENLEWVTYSENTLHAYRERLMTANPRVGESCHFSKLTWRQACDIRKRYSRFMRRIESKYGVTKSTIKSVLDTSSWKIQKNL